MRTIVILIVVSGFIAYVGDRLGYRVGKLRLSLLGLRPKNTATLISILTGMLITTLSIALLAAISEETRLGLFNIEQIRADLATLADERGRLLGERDRLSNEVTLLRNDLLETKKSVEALRRGDLVFEKNELLGYVEVPRGEKPERVVAEIRKLIENGHATVRKLGFRAKPLDAIWEPMKGTIEIFARSLDADMVIALRALERVAKGEEISLNLQALPDRPVFRRGDALDGDIDATGSRESIRAQVIDFFEEISELARARGMLVDPFRSFDTFARLDLVNELKARGGKVRLTVVVGADCGLVGPLLYSMQISKAGD